MKRLTGTHNPLMDDFEKCVTTNKIQDIYMSDKKVTSIPKLLLVIIKKMYIPGEEVHCRGL